MDPAQLVGPCSSHDTRTLATQVRSVHVCTRSGLAPATSAPLAISAPGLGSSRPHLQVFDARGKVQSFTHILETKQPASQ